MVTCVATSTSRQMHAMQVAFKFQNSKSFKTHVLRVWSVRVELIQSPLDYLCSKRSIGVNCETYPKSFGLSLFKEVDIVISISIFTERRYTNKKLNCFFFFLKSKFSLQHVIE